MSAPFADTQPPFTLPNELDPATGQRIRIDTGPFGAGVSRYVVPGGKAWLVTTFSVPFRYVGAAGARYMSFGLETTVSGSRQNKWAVTFGPFATGQSGIATVAIGASMSQAIPLPATNFSVTAGLPLSVLYQGDAVEWETTSIDPNDGGSDTYYLEVIEWTVGLGGDSGQLLGPFMWVPGPETVTA